jgi:hypothetical protein
VCGNFMPVVRAKWESVAYGGSRWSTGTSKWGVRVEQDSSVEW